MIRKLSAPLALLSCIAMSLSGQNSQSNQVNLSTSIESVDTENHYFKVTEPLYPAENIVYLLDTEEENVGTYIVDQGTDGDSLLDFYTGEKVYEGNEWFGQGKIPITANTVNIYITDYDAKTYLTADEVRNLEEIISTTYYEAEKDGTYVNSKK